MNEYLAIPDLMIIDRRRESGDLVAPLMRSDFTLVGPMVLKEPLMTPLNTAFLDLGVGGLALSISGSIIGLSPV